MSCSELRHIQLEIESAREELRKRAAESAPDRGNEFAFDAWERVLRTSLFSAEIDAQFHRARCPQCRTKTAEIAEPLTPDLAQAA